MSAYETLDVMQIPLHGVNLIEANAGTGKTYNIVVTYIRLLLEMSMTVDQILVVSFTEAATAELRERIRDRLRSVQSVLQTGNGAPEDIAIVERCSDQPLALRQIQRALQSFDQAAIYTIHAFCQRLLADTAFETGLPFQTELVTDDDSLRQQLVEDFWFAEAATGSGAWVSQMIERASPTQLIRDLGRHLGRPPLHGVVPVAGYDSDVEERFLVAAKAAQQLWVESGAEIQDLLRHSECLHLPLQRKIDDLLQAAEAWAESGHPAGGLKALAPLSAVALAEKTKKKFVPPQHAFFDAMQGVFELREQLHRDYSNRLAALRERLLEFAWDELPRRKKLRRLRNFDDLLSDVYVALQSDENKTLVSAVREQYKAALIDEFQDTDPLQFAVFSGLFCNGELPVFFVGDPKQAIYAFRGADVFAYLEARQCATRRYRLEDNYRSTPQLVAGVNSVFTGRNNPFVIDGIDFSPSTAAKDKPGLYIADELQPALRWWHVPASGNSPLRKPAAEQNIAESVATDIVALMQRMTTGQVNRADGSPLLAKDIAVLVNTNQQGGYIRDALSQRGIDSRQRSSVNVFETLEADELFVVLRAVVDPARHALVRAALASRMLGFDAAGIHALDSDEEQWQQLLDRFSQYPILWRDHGFARMFRRLCRDFAVESRLSCWPEGERSLANHAHLAELLQQESVRHHGRLDKVLEWMRTQQRLVKNNDDNLLLRLESDENLVNIITVHLSKGLQFPVVYCPYLWSAAKPPVVSPVVEFHDADHRPLLDLGADKDSPGVRQAEVEKLAERVRLAYVALTRAELTCTVVWGRINTAKDAGLNWLLHGSDNPASMQLPKSDAAMLERLRQLEGPAVVVESLPAASGARLKPEARAAAVLQSRELVRNVPGGWRVSSFSALTRDVVEEPRDYDAVRSAEQDEAATPQGIFAFPRGARAGRCMHTLLENISFGAGSEKVLIVAEQALAEHGFGAERAAVLADMVRNVLATPLDEGGICLRDVSDDQRVNELEFYYPLAALKASGLRRVLGKFASGSAIEQRLERLDFRISSGFMHGFIDLIFEADGRYYLADYKSNWLGDTLADYDRDRLAPEIARHDYYLQYLIYSIALHRHLSRCLSGYDYERNFGGVYYLFLRGMHPDSGSRHGIFFDRPEQTLLQELERLVCGDSI